MSEEEKAFRRLEEMKNNYSLNGKDLHYANLLYYLIINLYKKSQKLQQENQQLKERIEYLERSNNRREETIISLRDELVTIESVLDEIREYIEELKPHWLGNDMVLKILDEILDKINTNPNDVSKIFENCTTLEPFLEYMDKVKEWN